MTNSIVGFGADDHVYTVNGVRYVVQSRYNPVNFKNPEQNTRINSRIEKYLTSDFAELPIMKSDGNIDNEYVYLAAGKEENNAAKK